MISQMHSIRCVHSKPTPKWGLDSLPALVLVILSQQFNIECLCIHVMQDFASGSSTIIFFVIDTNLNFTSF